MTLLNCHENEVRCKILTSISSISRVIANFLFAPGAHGPIYSGVREDLIGMNVPWIRNCSAYIGLHRRS